MIERLDDILDGLVILEADRATLKLESGGLEVTMYHGPTGVGGMVTGPRAGAIMEEVVTRAELDGRTKGHLRATVDDRQVEFIVEEYDHFGETAFELRVRE